MRAELAHIFDPDTTASLWWLVASVSMLGAVAALVGLHHRVAGFGHTVIRTRMRTAIATFGVFALVAVATPAAGGAQSNDALLPDLVSDPPRPSFFTELNDPDTGSRLVVTFDGYVHNIGEGALDVVGNPQVAGGMKQRVFNGTSWEDVGEPTIRYETDDGHNHFHLIEAIEYVLWDGLQGAQSAIGSKVGFCLVDSEQMEPVAEQAYSEELDNFCEEDNPSATSLRMGISPGWRDIYDATTTLQWVDVSTVAPGRYWIGAITDPNDEILESNENNNDLIFSDQTIAVPGFSPRPNARTEATDTGMRIELKSTAHGTVTQPVYVIEQGPVNGQLDVPIGAALDVPVVHFVPDAGFTGQDELTFSVRDTASPYPFKAPTQTVTFEVVGERATNAPTGEPPLLTTESTFFEHSLGERVDEQVSATTPTGEAVRVFAAGLPAGLVVDSASGEISGIAIEGGFFDVELFAVADDGATTTQSVTWIVNPADQAAGLTPVADRSTPRGELTRLRVGAPALGQEFEASGLPPGVEVNPTSPVVEGRPSEVGEFNVVIRQRQGDEIVAETRFVWTIRPTADVAFVL